MMTDDFRLVDNGSGTVNAYAVTGRTAVPVFWVAVGRDGFRVQHYHLPPNDERFATLNEAVRFARLVSQLTTQGEPK